jgi:4-hydroxybenzoate polyprenyltransferase
MPYVRLLRPQQWVKNLFIFAGLIFGAKLGDADAVFKTILGFLCFCAASSAVYVVNDIRDREEDRLHPRKSKRPIAAGQVGVAAAAVMAAAMLALGLGGGWLLDRGFGLVVAAYLVLQAAYTFSLKHVVILDVITIGIGFVLRAVAGAVLINVHISVWLEICTFTLCLFMGFSKRRCELNAMSENSAAGSAAAHRRTLRIYTPEVLNHMTTLTAGVAIVSFLLYTMDTRPPQPPFDKLPLVYTLPLVVYAIFRFTVLVERGEVDGPTEVVTRDRPFQAAIVSWVAAALLIVYKGREFGAWLKELVGRAA